MSENVSNTSDYNYSHRPATGKIRANKYGANSPAYATKVHRSYSIPAQALSKLSEKSVLSQESSSLPWIRRCPKSFSASASRQTMTTFFIHALRL